MSSGQPSNTPPPDSPDLSPANFFLFLHLKRILSGHNFGNLDRLQDALEEQLSLIMRQEWADWFEEWIRRCHWCILFDGHYFEGMFHHTPPVAARLEKNTN